MVISCFEVGEFYRIFFAEESQAKSPAMKDDILTVRDVAEMLKLAEKTAYSLLPDGEIPGFKVGGSWRFRKTEIDRWIKEKEKRA